MLQERWTKLPVWLRATMYLLLFLLLAQVVGGDYLWADTTEVTVETVTEESEEGNFFGDVFHKLITFDSSGLMRTLGRPKYWISAFIVINLIVFTETGLLIGFFLPGDSLLVTAGVLAYSADWPVALLMLSVSISAIVGDSVGYSIGFQTGPKIFSRENSFLFNKKHLLKAYEFYEKHGGKTIIIARFIPILRTFAPVVAGVGQMNYRRFAFFNVFGGIGWVVSMVGLGYLLPPVIEPALKPIFGEAFEIQDHIEKVIILVVLASISPGIVVWLQRKFSKKKPATTETAGTTDKPETTSAS